MAKAKNKKNTTREKNVESKMKQFIDGPKGFVFNFFVLPCAI